MTQRQTYAASFAIAVERLGVEGSPAPNVERRPAHSDDPLGPSLFRTSVGDVELAALTLPGLFIGRSEVERLALRNCDLHLSAWCWNDFSDCNFDGSDLSQADLRCSTFVRCSFANSVLRNADLRHCTFEDCVFWEADLLGTKASHTFREVHALSERQISEIDWDGGGSLAPGG